MHLLDLPIEIIHLIFQSIPEQWGLGFSSLQRPHFTPDPQEYAFSLDLWSLNSFVQTCKSLYLPLNPSLYQWDAEFYSNRALRWAAGSGNVATARLALKVRLPEETWHKRWEYLYMATLQNQPAIVRLLLEHGLDPNRVAYWDTETKASGEDLNCHRIDLVFEAMRISSEPIVKLLLDHGAVTDRQRFRSMLLHAAAKGQHGIAKLLVENGCGLESIDFAEEYHTLCTAIGSGSTDMVRFFLEKGVCLDIQRSDLSLMSRAACQRDPEIVKMLLAYGVSPSPEDLPSINVLALEIAATSENYAVARLLRESIDLEVISSTGQNQEWLLLIAAACGWDDMVRQILDQGCLVDTRVANKFSFDSTDISNLGTENLPAISLAAGRGHYSTVQLLLSYNASFKPPSRYEEPFPLLHAVASGHLNIVELLLSHGAEQNGTGRWYCERKGIGDLPCIYWAVTYPDVFRLLLDRGADLFLPATEARLQIDRDPEIGGIVSLHYDSEGGERAPTITFIIQKALESGCTETVQILLDRGIPLQTLGQADCWSYQPLLIAAVEGGEGMTRLVLDHGLNVLPGSRDVEYAIYIAVSRAQFPLFKLLSDRGLLNSPFGTPGYRNILGMAIRTPAAPQTDTNADAITLDLPPEHGAYSEPTDSPLAKSPLDHLIMHGVAPGPENTDVFVQFLLEQGVEPLGGSSASTTPLANAFKRGYLNIVWLMLRVIDRQNIPQEELLLKLGMLLTMEQPDTVVSNPLAAYYAKRSRNLHRR